VVDFKGNEVKRETADSESEKVEGIRQKAKVKRQTCPLKCSRFTTLPSLISSLTFWAAKRLQKLPADEVQGTGLYNGPLVRYSGIIFML